jgi:hypothetical protein
MSNSEYVKSNIKFNKGDLVRFYKTNYHIQGFFGNILNFLTSKHLFAEIYSKSSKRYYRIGFLSNYTNPFVESIGDIYCREYDSLADRSEQVCFYQKVYDTSNPKPIKYKLTSYQADFLNAIIQNRVELPNYLWWSSSRNGVYNDYEFLYKIFTKLDRHINGSLYQQLDNLFI